MCREARRVVVAEWEWEGWWWGERDGECDADSGGVGVEVVARERRMREDVREERMCPTSIKGIAGESILLWG